MSSRGVNKVILIGNLGNEPDVRYMPSGDAMATMSIATSESWRDKNTGEMQDRTRVAPGGVLWQVGRDRQAVSP